LRERPKRGKRVGDGGCCQPVAHRAARSLDLGWIGVDLQKRAMRRECRRSAKLQRKVEALADQQHAVRLRERFGECAETRIGHPTRALHAHDSNPG
jgi:hypothetical protein